MNGVAAAQMESWLGKGSRLNSELQKSSRAEHLPFPEITRVRRAFDLPLANSIGYRECEALLGESLVEEWLNRDGFFTTRSVKP